MKHFFVPRVFLYKESVGGNGPENNSKMSEKIPGVNSTTNPKNDIQNAKRLSEINDTKEALSKNEASRILTGMKGGAPTLSQAQQMGSPNVPFLTPPQKNRQLSYDEIMRERESVFNNIDKISAMMASGIRFSDENWKQITDHLVRGSKQIQQGHQYATMQPISDGGIYIVFDKSGEQQYRDRIKINELQNRLSPGNRWVMPQESDFLLNEINKLQNPRLYIPVYKGNVRALYQ